MTSSLIWTLIAVYGAFFYLLTRLEKKQ